MVTVFKRSRPAIAMIELIFAIVVMGIVMLSIPMILNQSRQSSYVGFQQEAIAAAASQLGMLLTHHWDENDTDPRIGVPILQVTNGTGALAEITDMAGLGTGVRRGMPSSSARTFRQNIGGRSSAMAIGSDFNETTSLDYDDIDDYNGVPISLTLIAASTVGDYMDVNITMTATVAYTEDNLSATAVAGYDSPIFWFNFPADAPAGWRTNIKRVTLRLTTATPGTEITKDITMQALSCNIGSYDLNERVY